MSRPVFVTVKPRPLDLALSQAYGSCRPQRDTPLLFHHCPACARTQGRRLTVCTTCGGLGRVVIFG